MGVSDVWNEAKKPRDSHRKTWIRRVNIGGRASKAKKAEITNEE